jgi:hypothetical protein
MTNSTILRTLLTRTLNIQLPVKYHLLDNLSDISSVQLEKYKAYLPVFITYFKHLIEECIIYKKLLDNPTFRPVNAVNLQNAPILVSNLTDDFNNPIQYTSGLTTSDGSFEQTYKNNFHELLNNILI